VSHCAKFPRKFWPKPLGERDYSRRAVILFFLCLRDQRERNPGFQSGFLKNGNLTNKGFARHILSARLRLQWF